MLTNHNGLSSLFHSNTLCVCKLHFVICQTTLILNVKIADGHVERFFRKTLTLINKEQVQAPPESC